MTTKAQREKMTLMELIIEHQKVSERLERIKRDEDEDVKRKTKILGEKMKGSDAEKEFNESLSQMRNIKDPDEFVNEWRRAFGEYVDAMIDTALKIK